MSIAIEKRQLGGGGGGDGVVVVVLGAFVRWWPPLTMWAGPLIFFGHHRVCLNNSIFSTLGLCVACWVHSMCHHELWQTSVIHPFSFLNSSLGLAGGKHYHKITSPIFRLVLQNVAIPGYFPLFFSIIIFSPYFLQVGLLLQYVAHFFMFFLYLWPVDCVLMIPMYRLWLHGLNGLHGPRSATLMTSAAADVINHNGRKIARFKPRLFCEVNMHISAWIFA